MKTDDFKKMGRPSESLFFVAWPLPEPLCSQIQTLKLFLKSEYGLRHALKSPPHITLIPPFTSADEGELHRRLLQSASMLHPIDFGVSGYDSFDGGQKGNPVLFLKPTTPALNEWRSQYRRFVQSWGGAERSFIPHITLAHRDLTREIHKKILPELPQPFVGKGRIDRVALFRHNGKVWEASQEVTMEPHSK